MTKYIIGQMGENMKPRTIEVELGTPTPKTVEEVVVTFQDYLDEDGNFYLDPEDLIQILTAQNQAADERLREVLKEIKTLMLGHCGKKDCAQAHCTTRSVRRETWKEMETLFAKHGITNL